MMGAIKMTRREANAGILASAVVAAAPALAAEAIALPPPRSTGGKPLIEALKLRRSTREYSDRALPPEVLSDLLWAAFGVNRPSGDRTAPYWRHIMVLDVYAAMVHGVWFYDPKRHALVPHSAPLRYLPLYGLRREVVVEEGRQFPTQNHRQHSTDEGQVRWKMIVYADHREK